MRSRTISAMNGTEDAFNRIGAVAGFLVAALFMILCLYVWFHPLPPINRGYADGVYRNAECGSIKLRGGVATFNGSSVPYSLERTKNGVVAIPPHLLGVRMRDAGCKVTYDQSKFALYISLGRVAPPQAITLWDEERNLTYTFERDGAT